MRSYRGRRINVMFFGETGAFPLMSKKSGKSMGQPVVMPPGIFQQVVNKSTYSTLTNAKLEAAVKNIFNWEPACRVCLEDISKCVCPQDRGTDLQDIIDLEDLDEV